MAGLFNTLNTGRSGLNVSQSQLNTSSHNISNSNTEGYSRQRVKAVTSSPLSTGITGTGQIGTGVKIDSINRIRNTYLDYQLRNANSSLSNANIKSDILAQVEDVFNEPSDNAISTMIGQFFDAWEQLSLNPGSSNTRTVLTQTTLTLTDTLNSTYNKLEELEQNCQKQLKQNVVDINSLLNKIDEVNHKIKSLTASGQTPNDLLDTRDNYLDELSNLMGISTEGKSYNTINVLASDSFPMGNSVLVSSEGFTSARLSYITSIETDPNNSDIKIISYNKLGNTTGDGEVQTVKVTGLSDEDVKNLMASRIVWADSEGNLVKSDGFPVKDNELISASELMKYEATTGEVAGNTKAQEYIRNYKDHLDSLAKAMTYTINAVHSGLAGTENPGGAPAYDALPFFVNSDVASYTNSGNIANIENVLYAESNISAKNITINKEIINDVMKLKTSTHDCNFETARDNYVDAEGDASRASAIASLRNTMFNIQDFGTVIKSRNDLFDATKGGVKLSNFGMTISSSTTGMTIDSFYQDAINKLAVNASAAIGDVDIQTKVVNGLESNRESVSGVSLDEEMVDLIQYQHAYTANSKVISTINQLLDVVINGLIN